MVGRRPTLVGGLLVLAVLAGCVGPLDGAPADGSSSGGDGDGATTVTATVSADGRELASLALVVADTPSERRRGLMDRDAVPADGMLFVYPGEAERTFWMKDTRIPLDMIFVAANGTVVHVAHASPPPAGANDAALERYGGVRARYVIEVERGVANATGIAPGARVALDPRPTAS